MYTISICLFILKLHTSTAQFPAHVDLQKVGEIIFNNEKFNVLKPTTHIVTDYFKEFMLRRQNKHHPTKRVFIDDNGFRHSWSGYEDKIESLRKTDVKIEDNNEDDANKIVVNKGTNDNSPEDNDDNVNNDNPTENNDNNDSSTEDNDNNGNNDSSTKDNDDNENKDSPTEDNGNNENNDSPTEDIDNNENNDSPTEDNNNNENNDTPTENNDDNGNKDGTNTDVTEAVSDKPTAHWSYYEPIKKVDTNLKDDEIAIAPNKQVTTTSNKEGQGARKSDGIRKANTVREEGKTLATITFFCPFFGLMNMSAFVD